MLRLTRAIGSLSVGIVLLGHSLAPVHAQMSAALPPAGQESLDLLVGDILEILPAHDLPDPRFAWILTRDREFIQAGRTTAFRARLIQVGTYTLNAEILSSVDGRRLRRTFTITVSPRERTATPPREQEGSTNVELVSMDPAPQTENLVVLPAGQELLTLTPNDTNLKPLALDTDLSRDSDGDGEAGNDVEDEGTFFQTDATPLYIWLPSPLSKRDMSVTAVGPDGQALVQQMQVASYEYAAAHDLLQSPVRMEMREVGPLQYAFSAKFVTPFPSNTRFLYNWKFGDGQESLLTEPTHVYVEPGVYEVSLRVQNLVTGKTLALQTETLTIGAPVQASSAPVQQSYSSSAIAEESSSSNIVALVMKYLPLAGVFVGAIFLGILLVFLLGKLRKGKNLSEHLAAMEEKIVASDQKAAPPSLTIDVKAGPAVVQATTKTPEQVSQKEIEKAAPTRSLPTPTVDSAKAPDWLKKGLPATEGVAPKPEAPKPVAQEPAAPVPPKPAPPPPPAAPAASAAPAPSAPTGSTLPPWLKPDATNAPAPSSAAATTPAPAPAPQAPKVEPPKPMKPATAPAPKPAPAPAKDPAPAPDAAKSATPSPAPVSTSVPPAQPVSLAPKVEPPKAAPVAPKIESPKPAPPAQTPPAPVAPKPVAAAPIAPAAPVVPKPAAPTQVPVQQAPKAEPPKPVQPTAPTPAPAAPSPAPVQTPAPAQPAPKAEPKPSAPLDDDAPVAFIRAESLEKDKKDEGGAPKV